MNKQIKVMENETQSKTSEVMENQAFRGIVLHVNVLESSGTTGGLSVNIAAKMAVGGTARVPLAIWNGMFSVNDTGIKTLILYPGVEELPHVLDQLVFYSCVLPALWDVHVSITGDGEWEYSVEASLQG